MRGRQLLEIVVAVLLLVLVPLTGCYQPYQSTPSGGGKPIGGLTPSGFLGDYSGLAPDDELKGMIVYRKSPDVMTPYTKFIVDPFLTFFHSKADGKDSDPEELEGLTDYFRKTVIAELERDGGYEVVHEPGPGVARLRVAITDVSPGKGGASIEAEMLDSETSERLVAVVDSRKGRRSATKKQFDKWAQLLRERLDKLHEPG